MNATKTTTEKASDTNRNGARPAYIPLGTDDEGAHHVYRTTDETIHVVQGGDRTHVEDLNAAGHDVDDWMDFVTARRGWTDRQYGVNLVDMLTDSVEGRA